jgi:uncharacterized protein with GYD domain
MALYLVRLKQSTETLERLIDKPEDRRPVAEALAKALGGKLHGYWYAFGEYDVVVIAELPDNVAAATLVSKIAASGAWSGGETTVLHTIEEMLEATRTPAASSTARPARAAERPAPAACSHHHPRHRAPDPTLGGGPHEPCERLPRALWRNTPAM